MSRRWAPGITTAQRAAVTLEEREFVFDTDLNRFYVGDGSTAGGLRVANYSELTAADAAMDTRVDALEAGTGVTIAGALTGEYARTIYSKSQDSVSLLDFVPEAERLNVRIGVTAVQTYLQAALDATSGPPANKAAIINVPPGNYRFTAQVNVPNGKRITINFMGDARFYCETNITILSYVRPNSSDFTELTLVNAWFEKTGGVGTSKGIVFQGYDVTKDDSRLVIDRGQFRGLARGVQMKHATGYINYLYNIDNAIDFYLEHNASSLRISNVLSVRGNYFVYAVADAADGISNTLDVLNCQSVEKLLIDYYLYGWDAVNITGGGADLGGSGTGSSQAALWFDSCSHITVMDHYISSVTGGSVQQNRIGLFATGCYDISLVGKTVKHCAIGARFTNSLLLHVDRVNFDECDLNAVLVDGSASGTITNCAFDDDPDRTGTNFEIYGNIAGSTNWKVRNNKFAGTEFEPANPGGWDIGDNDWEQDLVP